MQKIMFNDRYGLTDAVLDGRKTMTRRFITPHPQDCSESHKHCWGADWANEPMRLVYDEKENAMYCRYCGNGVRWDGGYLLRPAYKVGEEVAVAQSYEMIRNCMTIGDPLLPEWTASSAGWRNKMFVKAELMPHRIRITGIRAERLQDISDEDCIKEGVIEHPYSGYMVDGIVYKGRIDDGYNGSLRIFDTPREAFAALIDKVSGRGTWASNPWVVAYEYELVK